MHMLSLDYRMAGWHQIKGQEGGGAAWFQCKSGSFLFKEVIISSP